MVCMLLESVEFYLQYVATHMFIHSIKICDTWNMYKHVASYSNQYVPSPTLGLSKPSKIFWFQMVLVTKRASLHASTMIPPQRSDGKGATNRSVDNWPFPAFQKQWAGSRLKCRCLFLSISFWILLSCSMGMAIGLNKHENWKNSGRAQIKTGPAPPYRGQGTFSGYFARTLRTFLKCSAAASTGWYCQFQSSFITNILTRIHHCKPHQRSPKWTWTP